MCHKYSVKCYVRKGEFSQGYDTVLVLYLIKNVLTVYMLSTKHTRHQSEFELFVSVMKTNKVQSSVITLGITDFSRHRNLGIDSISKSKPNVWLCESNF